MRLHAVKSKQVYFHLTYSSFWAYHGRIPSERLTIVIGVFKAQPPTIMAIKLGISDVLLSF